MDLIYAGSRSSFPSCCWATSPSPCFSRRNSDMSANGWLQFAIYCVILLLTVRPVGIYLARVLEGERTWLDPGAAPLRAADLQALRRERRKGDELARVRLCHARLLGRQLAPHLRHRAAAGLPAVEPAASRQRRPRSGLEHRRQLHHQHQLAVLHARIHHELSHRDGRPRHAQLLVGGRGHRGGRGPHSRHQAHHLRHHRQLLGRHDAHPALRPAARLASSMRCCWSPRAFRRICTPTPWRIRSNNQRRRRPSVRGRSPRRKPSRCWAPTAADSSTPTARIPTKTQRRFRTFFRFFPSSSFPPGSPTRWAA